MRFTFKLMVLFALVEVIFLSEMLVCVLLSLQVHFTHLGVVMIDSMLFQLEASFYFQTVLNPFILYY